MRRHAQIVHADDFGKLHLIDHWLLTISWGFRLQAEDCRLEHQADRTAARSLCNLSLRTASGPEGSSAKQILTCAAGSPGRGGARRSQPSLPLHGDSPPRIHSRTHPESCRATDRADAREARRRASHR
jgi:hypothetical protein